LSPIRRPTEAAHNNHRTYDGHRFSPLDKINKGNVKGLRLAYAVPLGGSGSNEWNEATPLVEDGFLYTTDSWGVLYKIDGTSGKTGRIVWRMDPKQEKQGTNRGTAFWGNLIISPANWPARIVAHREREREGRMGDQHGLRQAGIRLSPTVADGGAGHASRHRALRSRTMLDT
jgi:hypothetical protein